MLLSMHYYIRSCFVLRTITELSIISWVTHIETVYNSMTVEGVHLAFVRLLSCYLQIFSLHGCFSTSKSSCATLKHMASYHY